MNVLPPELTVLIDEDVWPEFRGAVARLAPRWLGPSGNTYQLTLTGSRLHVAVVVDRLGTPPHGRVVDRDLFYLACAVHEGAGEPWSDSLLQRAAEAWGYTPAASAAQDPDNGEGL